MRRRLRVCAELPPRHARGADSSSSTLAPASRAISAAHRAALPPPMTRTSGGLGFSHMVLLLMAPYPRTGSEGAKKSIPIDEGEWAWVKARKRSCPVPQLEAARARMVSRQSGVGVNCRRDQSEPVFELCLRWLAEIIRHMLPSIDHGPGELYDVPPLLRLCLHEDLEVCWRVGDHLA